MDVLDSMFPGSEGGEDAVPVVETPVEQQPEVTPEVVVEQPTPELPSELPEPEQRQADHIPLAKYLDQRDELKETKRRLAEYEQSQRQPQQAAPDVFDDPEGFAAYQRELVNQQVSQVRFEMSHAMAQQIHGAETVQSAVEWAQERAQKDPVFAASYMREANPIDWIVKQHKRDSLLSDIGDNVDDWFTREAVKRGYAATSASPAAAPVAVAPAPALRQPAPPRSIAADATPVNARGPGEPASFSAIFQR